MQNAVLAEASQKPVRFTVQDCTFHLGIQTIANAAGFDKWESFRPVLEDGLPYNSRETRKRYASSLRKWALENGDFSCLAARVWRSYQDAELLKQLLKERYLAAYPMLGRFVTQVLSRVGAGQPLPRQTLEDFLKSEQATYPVKTAEKLRTTMRDLGFLHVVGKSPVISAASLPATPFLILVHQYFAPSPATVAVSDVLFHPFWQHLGGRSQAEVRSALALAAAKDAIARYATVDHLEQITTRFSLQELLARQIRL